VTVDEMIDDILKHEGGYVNHPYDRGGPTNYGITQRTLNEWSGGGMDVREISEEMARSIYKDQYYTKPKIDWLAPHIQPIVFDMSVNHGPVNAVKILQKSMNSDDVVVDGLIGVITAQESIYLSVSRLVNARIQFYADIVANDNSQAVFLKGWLNRARSFS